MSNGARVRPQALRYVLLERLNRARRRYMELHEAEQPRLTFDLDSAEIIGQFLLAARAVYAKAETFFEAETGGKFRTSAWYKAWLAGLRDDQRATWQRLRADRVAEEHGEGVDLVSFDVDVTGDPSITNFVVAAAGGPLPKTWKPVARFATEPDRPASEVCAEYLGACQLFVHDFLRDHAHLLPGGT